MTTRMIRPKITEYDTWSYLYGSLSVQHYEQITQDGIIADPSCDAFDDELLDCKELCANCSFKQARMLGFSGPIPVNVFYNGFAGIEPLMLLFDNGRLTHIAEYDYGRAYFEPNQPRTAPCYVCQVETLVDAQ